MNDIEEKYKIITENIRDVVWILDPDTLYFDFVSPSVFELRGYTVEEIMAKPLDDALTPESAKMVREIIQRDIKNFSQNQKAFQVNEVEQPRKDGTTVWTEVVTKYYYDEKQQKAKILGVTRDITERRQNQANLIEQAQYFDKVIESFPYPFYIINVDDFTIVKANSQALLGNSPDIIGKITCHSLTHKFDKPCSTEHHQCPVNILRKTNKSASVEHIHYDENGNERIHQISAHPIFDKDGKLTQVIEYSQDITEKREIELKVIANEKKLQSIIETSPDAIAITDLEGIVKYTSQKAVDLWGYDNHDEIIGRNVLEFVHPSYHAKAIENIGLMMRGILTGPAEYLMLKKDGSTFYAEANASILLDENNNPSGILYVERDVTERKAKEEEIQQYSIELEMSNLQLKESNEIIEENLTQKNKLITELTAIKERLEITNNEKDKFFSIIAHDLKSPFSGFLGLTKILVEDLFKMSFIEIGEITSNLQVSAATLYKLLENLLEWSRIQQGKIEYNPEIISLHYIVQSNFAIQNEVAKQKEIKIYNNVSDNLTVYSDVFMLNTILRNLMSNAIKFTPRGGTVTISAERTYDNKTLVYVKDTGVGMSSETLKKLFKIDESVKSLGTEKEPSTGLGLLLCKEFVEMLGGNIWVESEVGIGSTFYFTILSEKL